MVVSKDFVFLHLQKCGGSFIRDFMLKHVPNSKKIVPQHNGFSTITNQHKSKPIIGVIRNPWDWYVSLYFYHMSDMKNSFMYDILKKGGDLKGWLKLFLTKDSGSYHDMKFGWMKTHSTGPYTYRVFKCFNRTDLKINDINDGDFSKVQIIKMENLVPNFLEVLSDNDIQLSDKTKEALISKKKVNTSNHTDYRDYYDDETRELVATKDKMLIDKFGYEF